MAKDSQASRRFKTSRVYMLAFNTMISGFLFGYNVGVFNPSMSNVGHSLHWGSNMLQMTAICGAIMPAGGFFGAMSSSVLSNKYGRLKTIVLADIVGFFAAGITILPHTSMFVLGRFLSGIMVGLLSSVSSVYMAEISPSEIRGRTGSMFQLLSITGLTTSFALGLVLPTTDFDSKLNNWWLFMFGLPAVFNILQAIAFLTIFKLESPYWLMRKGRQDETLSVLNSIYLYDVDKILDQISQTKGDPLESELKGNYFSKICQIFAKNKFRKMLRLALILGLFQPLSGYGAISLYSTTLFKEITGDMFQARVFTVILGISGIVGVISMIFIIDKLGRKFLFIAGSIGMAASQLCTGSFLVGNISTNIPMIICIYMYMYTFNISIGPVLLPYISEIGIPQIIGLCVGILWLGFILTNLLVPYAIAGIGPGPLFYIFAGICVVAIIYMFCDVLETKGMTKEAIRGIIAPDHGVQLENLVSEENDCEEFNTHRIDKKRSHTSKKNRHRDIESEHVIGISERDICLEHSHSISHQL
jgi:SP family arabinose:H+ symporter-like MFS transporter